MVSQHPWWIKQQSKKEYLTPEELTKRYAEQEKVRKEIMELQRKSNINRVK